MAISDFYSIVLKREVLFETNFSSWQEFSWAVSSNTCILTFWHRSFTLNSNKSPTWCHSFSVYYSDVCLQLNMFLAFSRPTSEAATAVIELLMMGGKTPETCWAVNKRQDNKLKNCCIRLVIYLNCTMMHELTNLKFYI